LPLLPPTLPFRCHFFRDLAAFATHNAKRQVHEGGKPLECGIRAEGAPDTRPKSGKNGNVDRATQHCRTGRSILIHPRLLPVPRPFGDWDYPRHSCREANVHGHANGEREVSAQCHPNGERDAND
jgi:hypothetical protein